MVLSGWIAIKNPAEAGLNQRMLELVDVRRIERRLRRHGELQLHPCFLLPNAA
jgi:hypothetical protein